jgi:hypothetical protein
MGRGLSCARPRGRAATPSTWRLRIRLGEGGDGDGVSLGQVGTHGLSGPAPAAAASLRIPPARSRSELWPWCQSRATAQLSKALKPEARHASEVTLVSSRQRYPVGQGGSGDQCIWESQSGQILPRPPGPITYAPVDRDLIHGSEEPNYARPRSPAPASSSARVITEPASRRGRPARRGQTACENIGNDDWPLRGPRLLSQGG